MKVRFAAAVAAISFSCSAQAVVIVQKNDLPTAMQGNFGSMVVSSFNTTNMAAFGYMENSVAKWLIRYNVTAPSHESYSSYDSWTGISTSSYIPFTGSLWLTANQSYNLADASHPFTLFTDKVTPNPSNSTFVFDLSSTALLSGNAFWETYYDEGGQQALTNFNTSPVPVCIECPMSIDFNLIMLKYSNVAGIAQLSFDATDTRAILFQESDYHPDFGYGSSSHVQSYYVQSVPVPSGFWLFASGLMGIGALARKKKAQLIH